MICRICHKLCEVGAVINRCADCLEVKTALARYYGSIGGGDFTGKRQLVRAGAKAIVEAHRRAKAQRNTAYVN